jgi:hypothetical protein
MIKYSEINCGKLSQILISPLFFFKVNLICCCCCQTFALCHVLEGFVSSLLLLLLRFLSTFWWRSIDLKLLALSVVVYGPILLLKSDQEKNELRFFPTRLPSSSSSLTLPTCHLYSFFHSISSFPLYSWFVIGIDSGEVYNECWCGGGGGGKKPDQ